MASSPWPGRYSSSASVTEITWRSGCREAPAEGALYPARGPVIHRLPAGVCKPAAPFLFLWYFGCARFLLAGPWANQGFSFLWGAGGGALVPEIAKRLSHGATAY